MANKITAIILHYKRPHNINEVIEGIRKQTVPCDIIVWDNSGDYPIGSGEDIYFRAEKNNYCQARYSLINSVYTEYIFNTDDDLAILDNTLFEKFIAFSERHPNAVIGWNGRTFSHPNMNWEKAYSFPNGGFVDWDESESVLCDTINFGVSFLPTRILKGKDLNPFVGEFKVSESEFRNGDDIWISAQLKEKRVMPFNLKPLFKWLDEGKFALSKMPDHMKIRDALCRRWWEDKYK